MDVQRSLVERIEALRNRLEEPTASSIAAPLADASRLRLQHLLEQFTHVQANNQVLEERLTELLHSDLGQTAKIRVPEQLAWRTKRLLLRCKGYLDQLRDLSSGLPLQQEATAPLGQSLQRGVAMTELVLRSVQAFPNGAAEQLQLADGLEAMLDAVAERLHGVRATDQLHGQAENRLDTLAHWLQTLVQGRPVLIKTIEELADTLLQDAEGGTSIHWYALDYTQPPRWAAASGLHCAQVIARLRRGHDLGAATTHDVMVAALVHDAGMAGLPAATLQHAGPLDETQRREIEAHVGLGVEGLRRLVPQEGWLIEAVLAHHERMDGTGYPKGKPGKDLPRLARLLAVVDVYVASQCVRPYRPATSPRAALTETLLEAERGRLDPAMAERLLELSFYPSGTHVELSDGRIAVVVATQHLVQDLTAPAKPIVQILADAEGTPAALPIHLNLAQCAGLHVVRSLPRAALSPDVARLPRSALAA